MLSRKLLAVSKKPEFVGAVTLTATSGQIYLSSLMSNINTTIDILSVAQVGDLVVFGVHFDGSGSQLPGWSGMSITTLLDWTTNSGYMGYHIVQAGDTNPTLSPNMLNKWRYGSAIAAVFRNVSYEDAAVNNGYDGHPDPPALTANGRLWVVMGGMRSLSDGAVYVSSGYTEAAIARYDNRSMCGIGYRVAGFSSADPAVFTSSSTAPRDAMAATIALR